MDQGDRSVLYASSRDGQRTTDSGQQTSSRRAPAVRRLLPAVRAGASGLLVERPLHPHLRTRCRRRWTALRDGVHADERVIESDRRETFVHARGPAESDAVHDVDPSRRQGDEALRSGRRVPPRRARCLRRAAHRSEDSAARPRPALQHVARRAARAQRRLVVQRHSRKVLRRHRRQRDPAGARRGGRLSLQDLRRRDDRAAADVRALAARRARPRDPHDARIRFRPRAAQLEHRYARRGGSARQRHERQRPRHRRRRADRDRKPGRYRVRDELRHRPALAPAGGRGRRVRGGGRGAHHRHHLRAAEQLMAYGISAFAEVAVPVAIHGSFTYAIPEELRDGVRLGSRVEVPLGTKRTTGFVVALIDHVDDPSKLKPIRAVLDDDEPALTPEIIELCRWAAEYYIAPLGEMLRTALPANMSARGRREVVLVAEDPSRTLDSDLPLINELRKRPLPLATIFQEMRVPRSAIDRLRDAGIIAVRDRLQDAKGVRYDRFVVFETAPDLLKGKQLEAVELLQSRGGEMSVRALENAGIGASTLSTLARKEIVRIERRPRRHTLDAFLAGLDPGSISEFRYSAEQRAAIDAVMTSLGTFAPFLIEGVTGSGKTEVYIELMREVVKRGEQALLLVPEISLTPVFAARLKERFGDRIAILHSSLSPSERYDQWWRARRGEVDVA